MTHVIRAELVKLIRRPTLLAAAGLSLVFALVTSLSVLLSAGTGPRTGRTPTIDSLSQAGGGTEAFALGISVAGLLVLVMFVANVTGEISRGTFRTLLMREPGRLRLLAGKMAALLAFTAAIVALAAVLSFGVSALIAPSQGISTADWFGLAALREGLGDYGTGLVTVGAWALIGMALGIVLRSTPIALGVAVAWAGPFEHITQDSWSTASEWFPGLLLEAVAAGGTDQVALSRALPLALAYVALAAVAAAMVFRRRDVTA
jgi:ABC-type transport system involved in multi-copper enzyme maturation permease subunit